MPFTPFHLGPGAVFKALLGRRFSLITFGFAQVAMDVEPLVRMIRGDDVVHGATHTYLGALAVGAGVCVFARPLARPVLVLWRRELAREGASWLAEPPEIGRWAVAAGAFLGTISHVALDSLMHADLRPLAPFSAANPLLGLVDVLDLHRACVLAGVAGVAVWVLLRRARIAA